MVSQCIYLYTAHKSGLEGNDLNQSQKQHTRLKKKKQKTEIHKYAENFYAWCDVGERKCRLVESLSRVLKYN